MGINLVSDLDCYFEDSEFAVMATYNGGQIPVIFDNGHEEIETNLGVIEGLGPTALCKSADVEDVVHEDILTIPVDGTLTRYKVVEIKPDGHGATTLTLMETT